jgi:hypothetical protein
MDVLVAALQRLPGPDPNIVIAAAPDKREVTECRVAAASVVEPSA